MRVTTTSARVIVIIISSCWPIIWESFFDSLEHWHLWWDPPSVATTVATAVSLRNKKNIFSTPIISCRMIDDVTCVKIHSECVDFLNIGGYRKISLQWWIKWIVPVASFSGDLGQHGWCRPTRGMRTWRARCVVSFSSFSISFIVTYIHIQTLLPWRLPIS